ncbi:MAG: autotransporter outer membrane beta-barrel domain-containing protein [Cyclobacteriaceae bacterium]
MTKRRFEDELKSAFEDAEVSPSETVWTAIELDLEKASGTKVRREALVYRWLAAASVSFALGVGALYFLSDTSPRNVITTHAKANDENISSDRQTGSTRDVIKGVPGDYAQQQPKENQPPRKLAGQAAMKMPAGATFDEESDNIVADKTVRTPRVPTRQVPVLYSFKNPELKSFEPVADPGMVLLAKLADEEKAYRNEEKKNKKDERLWTSVGFGAGTFNPNAGSSARASGFNATGNSTAGLSYSVGAAIGGQLSNRFVLQGGVSYLHHSASYTSSSFSMEASTAVASLDDYIDTQTNVVATSPYGVSSDMQYISLPVQAGYLLLNRDFAIQLNGGVATDFFLQNTLTPDNGNVATVTQKAGGDSPYRLVNFSGIVGTEVSYKFAGRYRIAINPGIRYAFHSFYKPAISREITPVTYDVALRFRYVFN